MILRKFARWLIERHGYNFYKVEFSAYGISPFVDIQRLSQRLSYPIETFFDVGANIGQTARQALRAFPSASVVCFDPHPATFAELTANLAGSKRIATNNVPLGS